MSAEHVELAGLIMGRTTTSAVEAVLAAGYRKPPTINTAEQLDALPIGSVVILRDSKRHPHPAQKGEHGWRLPFLDQFWSADALLKGAESAEVVES